jgi:hypothetical protein
MSAHTPKNLENRCLLSFLVSLMACFSYSLFRFFVPTVRKPLQEPPRSQHVHQQTQAPGARIVAGMNLAKPGTIQASFFPSKPKPGKNVRKNGMTPAPLKEHCEQCNQPLWVAHHNHRSCDVSGLSEPFCWPIFSCSALDKGIAMCYDQYSTSQYPRG